MLRIVLLVMATNAIVHSKSNRLNSDVKNNDKLRFVGNDTWVIDNNVYNISEKYSKIKLHKWQSKEISCQSLYYPEEFAITYKNKNEDTEIKVLQVTDEMSTTWNCSLKRSDGTYAHIFFDVNVEGANPPQIILVNSVVLRTRRDLTANIYQAVRHNAIHYYKADDQVDVTCINPGFDQCTIQLNYDYAEALSEMFTASSNMRVGFRAVLKTIHNNSHMKCMFICSTDYSIEVVVTFLLIEGRDEAVSLKVNGLTVRGTNTDEKEDIYLKYAYFLNYKPLAFAYKLNKEDIVFNTFCNGWGCGNSKDSNTEQYYTPIKDTIKTSKLGYTAIFKDNNRRESLHIGFTTLDAKFIPQPSLNINLPKNNTLIEIYEYHKKVWIYYEYNDGDKLYLTCSRARVNIPTSLHFEGSESNVQKEQVTITKRLSLNITHNNTTIQCKEVHLNKELAVTRILLRMKDQNAMTSAAVNANVPLVITTIPSLLTISNNTSSAASTSTSTSTSATISSVSLTSTSKPDTDDDSETLMIVVVVIVVIIATACFAATMYYVKRRNRLMQAEAVVQFQKTHTDANPTEYDYAVLDIKQCIISTNDVNKDIYAKPTPKRMRQVKHAETLYANENITHIDQKADGLQETNTEPNNESTYVNKTLNTDVYSEVLPKSKRMQINANCSNVVNSPDSIDLEPMYSELNVNQ